MAIPVIVSLLSSILGSGALNSKKEDGNKLSFTKQNTPQQAQPATVGDVAGQPVQQQPGGWDKFQNGANKAMTIANLLNSLRSNDQQQQGFQMQFNRRR